MPNTRYSAPETSRYRVPSHSNAQWAARYAPATIRISTNGPAIGRRRSGPESGFGGQLDYATRVRRGLPGLGRGVREEASQQWRRHECRHEFHEHERAVFARVQVAGREPG